jgi:hypothetical protein
VFPTTGDGRRATRPPADAESLLKPQQVRSGRDRRDLQQRFTDEDWLTPIQIARKLGYSTDKPIRNAIRKGELKAIHTPCRRRLIVAESEVLRWIDEDLAYEPVTPKPAPKTGASRSHNPHARRAGRMPTLRYDPSGRERA